MVTIYAEASVSTMISYTSCVIGKTLFLHRFLAVDIIQRRGGVLRRSRSSMTEVWRGI